MRSPPGGMDRQAPPTAHATVEVQTCNTYIQSRGRPNAPGHRVRRRIISGDDRTLAGVGEFGLIAELPGWLPHGPRTLVGIGDDAAVLATPDGRGVAAGDFLLAGQHFP